MRSLFSWPGVLTAWMLKAGDVTPTQLANRCADAGFKWIAQQVGENDPTVDQVAELRHACNQRSLYFGIWEQNPRSLDNLFAVHPNFWLLVVEAPWDGYAGMLARYRLTRPLLPTGCVTNCDLDAAPFIRWNVKAMPEAYQVDNPVATPQNMVNRCLEMGWRKAFPVLGVYGQYPLSSYTRAGDGWSVYLADEMQAADWETAREWNT